VSSYSEKVSATKPDASDSFLGASKSTQLLSLEFPWLQGSQERRNVLEADNDHVLIGSNNDGQEAEDEEHISETETYMVEYANFDDETQFEESQGGIVTLPYGYVREDVYSEESPPKLVEIVKAGHTPTPVSDDFISKKTQHKKITSAPVRIPFPINPDGECKGNCPLKHNLLPKYEPDDGGQLKCPEHDGRKFRSKQGALFEVACYADYGGRNMKVETETSLDACINTCTNVTQCKAVVFVPGELDGACYLKFNQGKSHMNPFVMSARMAATDCGNGIDCDRHNKVWEMEQEDARRERQRTQIEETRSRIEDLRKERANLERQRHNQRMQRIKDSIEKDNQTRVAEADKARFETYAKQEEAYAQQKHHETVEKQRDQSREERRFKWRLATEERERERLRHQVEREREALHTELDKMAQGEWANDEGWWRASRFQTHSAQGIKDNVKAYEWSGLQAGDHEFDHGGDYPTDDEWYWYPDPSWAGYWDAEGVEREIYEGWVTEDEHDLVSRGDLPELVKDGTIIRRAVPPRPTNSAKAVKSQESSRQSSPIHRADTAKEHDSVDQNGLPIIESSVSERKKVSNTHRLVLGEDITSTLTPPAKSYYFSYSDEDIKLAFLNYAKSVGNAIQPVLHVSRPRKERNDTINSTSEVYIVLEDVE
jgi:hypothetical protein